MSEFLVKIMRRLCKCRRISVDRFHIGWPTVLGHVEVRYCEVCGRIFPDPKSSGGMNPGRVEVVRSTPHENFWIRWIPIEEKL